MVDDVEGTEVYVCRNGKNYYSLFGVQLDNIIKI